MATTIKFDEETIQALFGNEAAEDETLERLKQYYVKNKTYEKITANLPLRILVGHKGIGKSALFKVAMSEDIEKGNLPIFIQPNDIVDLEEDIEDSLQAIRKWELGLLEIIANKVLQKFGSDEQGIKGKLKKGGSNILKLLHEAGNKVIEENVNIEPINKGIIEMFLKNNKITVYVDDLDRGWISSKSGINRISSLLNAVRDIINDNKGIYFRIALRSDVYFLVRTSDESTDKIENSVIWYSWTNHEILVLLIKRIETFFGRLVNEEELLKKPAKDIAYYLHPVIEPTFSGQGKWLNAPTYKILMSLIRKRPRDLVKLCTLAAREAYDDDSPQIMTRHFKKIFNMYSQGRIQDTINEYKSELPEIERLLMGMKPNKIERRTAQGFTYNTTELYKKINSIMEQGKFKFASGKEADVKELANFLYKTNFLTARKELANGEVERKYFEENMYLSGHNADFGYDWEVHPAYRWALNPSTIDEIYSSIGLSEVK